MFKMEVSEAEVSLWELYERERTETVSEAGRKFLRKSVQETFIDMLPTLLTL